MVVVVVVFTMDVVVKVVVQVEQWYVATATVVEVVLEWYCWPR